MNIKRIKKSFYFSFIILISLVAFLCGLIDARAVDIGTSYPFNYTGGIQTFKAPNAGYYQLEVWGGQGASEYNTGFGGYSTGVVFLDRDEIIYVVVGGAGARNSGVNGGAGGYNGGGNGGRGYGSYIGGRGGGGATHIAKVSGVLSGLSGNKDKVLIVAGGGGGAYAWCTTSGSGGGFSGSNGRVYSGSSVVGGNQTAGYSFGKGQNGRNASTGQGYGGEGTCGAGGGWYGGYAYQSQGGSTNASGAGGSGYINNSLLLSRNNVTKSMYCYQCSTSTAAGTYTVSTTSYNATATAKTAKSGAGYAKITLLEKTNLDARIDTVDITGTNFKDIFDRDTYEYNISVDSENAYVDVSALPVHYLTTIVGNQSYELEAGASVITLIGTSGGGAVSTYTIHVNRLVSPYKYLRDIKIDGKTIEGFTPEKLTYNIEVPFDTTDLNLEILKGRPSQHVYYPASTNINSGLNKIEVPVVSEDGASTTIYTLNITKPHSSKLKSLIFSSNNTPFKIEPEFDPLTNSYTLSVLSSTLALKVDATPLDEEASIKTEGFGYIKSSGVGKVIVSEPNSEDTVYTINIIKDNANVEVPFEFGSSNSIQTFVAPATGFYRLEAWGAQGGTSGIATGFGGYSTGVVFLNRNDTLYVVVGGAGASNSGVTGGKGGYNGGGAGGKGWNRYVGGNGGGGATHIARSTGLLSQLNGNLEDILIVAGGGGGAYGWASTAGAGGGYRGGVARTNSGTAVNGATQTTGYGFGIGQSGRNGTNNNNGGEGGNGAGAGLYGGYTYQGNGNFTNSAGSGGSGYIGNTDLISYDEVTKVMYCYNCNVSNEIDTYTVSTNKYATTPTSYYAKGGAGYAKISLLKMPSENNFLSSLTLKVNGEKKNYTPTFNMEIEDYYITLGVNETSLNISARPEDSTAKIEGLGAYDIPAGTTDIPIVVTAEAGNKKTYTVHVTRPASDNPYPIDIVINGLVPSLCERGEDYCILDPTSFDPSTDTYYIAVPSRIKQLYFQVEKGHAYQTVVGEGKVSLEAGENPVVIEVQSEDGKNFATYTYYVYRDMTGNTDLSKLEILDPLREIHYDPDVTEYYITVPNEYDHIRQLNVETDDPNAEYIIQGNQDFVTGMNEVNILVIAQNGETLVYTLHVYREKSGNAFLDTLGVRNGSTEYSLLPLFNKLIMDYKLTVPNEVSSVEIYGTAEAKTTTSLSGDIGIQSLHTGMNSFAVITTAEDGSIETYNLSITREKNNNPDLSSITVRDNNNKEYSLNPIFDKDTLEYNIVVDIGVSSLDITATPFVDTTIYKLLDNKSIKVGSNVKRVMGVAEDGTSKTYILNITRPASDNCNLSKLLVVNGENSFQYEPNFHKDTLLYELEVENEITNLTITGIKEDNYANVMGNGKYSLLVGENTLSISVMAEDGISSKSYTLVVNRKPNSDATLKAINTSVGILSPTFDKNTFSYTINVDDKVSEINLEGTPSINTTTVSGNGLKKLVTGNNDFEFVTKAEDNSSLTYHVRVVKDASSNANIRSLIMKEGVLDPEFKSNIINYKVYVPHTVTNGTFLVELEHEEASYAITNNGPFEFGSNFVHVVVTSEAGETKDYQIEVIRQEEGESSNYLTNITVSSGSLSPSFYREGQYYEVVVPNLVEAIEINAEKEDKAANLTGTGKYNLEVGENLITLRVTSVEGIIRDYQIMITREPSTEARLSSIVVSGSSLTPNFDKDTFHYSLETEDASLDFTRIIPVNSGATYEVIGNSFSNTGDYEVIIRVTAEDKITTKDYVLNVKKLESKNNYLSSLEVDGYTISPTFNKNTTMYYLTVGDDVNNILVKAQAEDHKAVIDGVGIINLVVGENAVKVTVTSESGAIKVYTIVVTKNGSDNNNIASLEVKNGLMIQSFEKERLTYDVEVPYEEESLDLLVQLEDEKASYVINNNELDIGENVVSIVVTSESGISKTYNLNVMRKEIVSSLLKSLKVKDFQLTPQFNSYIFTYDITVNYENNSLEVIAAPLDKNAKIEISGHENLVVGMNTIKIKVTASDNSSTTEYTIDVLKQNYANNFLDYLYTDKGDLTPKFNQNTLTYAIQVDTQVEEIELFGEAIDKSANVTGLGVHSLIKGENVIPVTVTSTSGITRTYIVTVDRKKSHENYLESLNVKIGGTNYELKPEFDRETLKYTVDVPRGTTSVNLLGTISHDATVQGLGLRNVKAGTNLFDVVVTAEDGTTRTYTISVNRPANSNANLINIIPSDGVLEPEFSYYDTEYTIHLPNTVSTLSFDVITEDPEAIATGHELQIVPDGSSARQIIVTAEDGTTKSYDIIINKERNDNAKLSNLSVTGYSFAETFDPEVYEYHISVPNDKQILLASEVNATAQDPNAKISKSDNLSLVTAGENTYVVRVTAPDGITTLEYKIFVTRSKGEDSLLNNLVVNKGYLTTTFNPNTLEYTWFVPKRDSLLNENSVSVITSDIHATVEKTISADAAIEDSKYYVTVTSEDGKHSTKYTLNLKILLSNDATLKDIIISRGFYKPEFNPNTLSYDVYVYDNVAEIDVLGVVNDIDANVIHGNGIVDLNSVDTLHNIIVEANDKTTLTYTLNIHKTILRDIGLKNIGLDGLEEVTCRPGDCELEPEFNTDKTDYKVVVPHEYRDLKLLIETMNDQQTYKIKVDGKEISDYNLPVGDTNIVIEVYDGMGVNTEEYHLCVTRKDLYDGRLDSLFIDKGYYIPTFNSNTYIYEAYEYLDEAKVNVFATLKDPTSTITSGIGEVTLTGNTTVHQITTVTLDGEITVYEIRINRSIRKDEGLKNIDLKGLSGFDCSDGRCVLNPVFDTDTLNYKVTVPNEYTKLDILAETMNEQQTVKYRVGEEYFSTYDLPLGKTNAVIEVYDGLNNKTREYTLEVTRDKPGNTYLASLEVVGYPINPEFRKNIYDYSIEIPGDVEEVVIHATAEDPLANVYINGYNYLEEGENIATVTVTAQNGTIKVYNVHIMKLPEINSYLKNITVSTGVFWDITPHFKSTVYEYTTTVSGIYDTVTIEGTPFTNTTKVTGNGEYSIKTGNNRFTLVSEAINGKTSTYHINIIKLESFDVDLENLIVEEGNLNPSFESGETKYNINVSEDVNQLTIHAIPKDRGASIIITGNNNLVTGNNKVNVIVMSRDKSMSKTYQLNVNKARSSNNYLRNLQVFKKDEKVLLNPSFTSTNYYYQANVSHDTEIVQIRAEAESIYASVLGAGEEALVYGTNIKNVKVMAEDGSEAEYTLEIYRNYNLNLASIIPDVGTLEPVFDPKTTKYRLQVDTDVEKISFIAFPESNKVSVEGIGTYDIPTGESTITFKVVAPDGKFKIYEVEVDKRPDDNNYIESLVVHQGGLDPLFEKEVLEYTTHVRKTTTALDLDVILESKKAQYEIIGNEHFEMGHNEVIIRVTAQNGEERDYLLNVYLEEDDYFSNRLLDLSISEGKLNPDFKPDTTYYAANLPNSTESVIISAVKESDGSVISGTGLVQLNVGRNVFPVLVTSKDGNVNTYTVVIYRANNNDATLSSLSVKNYLISPVYNKAMTKYKVTINKGESSLDVIAIPTDKNSTVEIIGNENLQFGNNTITVKVTAPDLVTTKTYTITVKKQQSTNNFLEELTVNGHTLDPEFVKTNNGPYSVEVDASVNSVVVDAIPEVKTTIVSGDGAYSLTSNSTLIKVTTTSESGSERVYQIIVNKKLNGDATLKELLVSDGVLEPVFDKETFDYTVEVPDELEEITVIGFVNHDKSTLVGNGTYKLDSAITNIPLIVTAEDGSSRTYRVNVIKNTAISSKILDLVVKNGELQPHFSKNIINYTVNVPNEVTSLDMIVTLEDLLASYEIVGNEDFKVGVNEVNIVVTGTDGAKTTYTIHVIRGEVASNYLTNLRVDGYAILPHFDKDVLYYTLTLPYDVDQVDIIATVEDATSTLTGDGTVQLEVGKNDNYITVTSATGVKRTYTIAITRKPRHSPKLRELIVRNGVLAPSFDPDTFNYTVSVPNEATSLDMLIYPECDLTTYEVLGNENFKDGKNLVRIVTSEINTSTITYNIVVTKDPPADNFLSNLEVVGQNIIPEFSKTNVIYDLTVPFDISKATIVATPENPDAVITGAGEVDLNTGLNRNYITVTSPDGIVRTYIVRITRNEIANIKLRDLIVKNGELKPKFNSNQTDYSVVVPNEVTSLDMIVTLEDENAHYTISGNENFVVGSDNKVLVTVTGALGSKNVYTIHVTRGEVADNYLMNLEVEDYTITPIFNKETLYYTLTVPYSTNKVNIIATLEDPGSSVIGDGEVTLSVGNNLCYITVTSSDGVKRTYTISITRESEFSSKIRNLIVKNGELKPKFHSNQTDYSVVVPNEVTSLDMIVTLEDDLATYKVEGNSNFIPGNNQVKVIVTSRDGYETTYHIHVTRGVEADNYLMNLEVEDYTITPIFNKETLYYTLMVPTSTNKVNIIATLEDPRSSVVGTGNVSLNYGRNDKYVTVTSSDGVKRTYTISITRESNDDNKLLTLESDKGVIEPTFEPTINDYTLSVSSTVTEVNLTGTISDGASVVGLGTVSVETDSVQNNIIVTSATGRINTYTIQIVRGSVSTELLKLVPSVGTMDYSNDLFDYEIVVEDNDSTISFDYELKDPTASITGVELRPLEYGENNIEIIVTSTKGDIRTIHVKVIRNKDLIAINPEVESIVMMPEEEKDITYTFDPIDTTYTEVEFHIEDEDIATVDQNGKVTAHEFGSTVLKITSKKNPLIYAEVTIDVLSTKITSGVLDIIRDVSEEECEYDTCPDIVIGEEVRVALQDFLAKFDNDASYLQVFDQNGVKIEDLTTFTGSRMILKLVIREAVHDEIVVVVRGDYDGDGKASAVDQTMMDNHILRILTRDYINSKIGDLDFDGKVSAVDQTMLDNFILRIKRSLNNNKS